MRRPMRRGEARERGRRQEGGEGDRVCFGCLPLKCGGGAGGGYDMAVENDKGQQAVRVHVR